MKDFLHLSDLAPEAVAELLALAGRLERHPEPEALKGKILALLFFNPSLRTLASFQAGMARLGGSAFVISPGQGTWLLETRDGVVMDGAAAELSGGSLRETADRAAALEGAHVLYAKSWTSPRHYGDLQAEAEFRDGLRDWCVGDDWFDTAASECRFMHCLPVRRNVVVKDSVLDGPRSVVVHEARNRMWAQMAVLHRLLKG